MVVVIDSSVPGRVARFLPAWRKYMPMTIRPASTIVLSVCQRLTPSVTTFIPFGGSTLGFIHAFVAVFSGWRRDRCQTKALDLTMKELEVKRASAQPQNILSPSTQNDPDLS